jgi:hypothetical protein
MLAQLAGSIAWLAATADDGEATAAKCTTLKVPWRGCGDGVVDSLIAAGVYSFLGLVGAFLLRRLWRRSRQVLPTTSTVDEVALKDALLKLRSQTARFSYQRQSLERDTPDGVFGQLLNPRLELVRPVGQRMGAADDSEFLPHAKPEEVFDQVGGQLLIVGEPGSGKTVLIGELARHVIDTRPELTPVIVNLSGWSGHASFRGFLVAQLRNPANPAALTAAQADAVLTRQLIALFLDGLDEVGAGFGSDAVDKLLPLGPLVRFVMVSSLGWWAYMPVLAIFFVGWYSGCCLGWWLTLRSVSLVGCFRTRQFEKLFSPTLRGSCRLGRGVDTAWSSGSSSGSSVSSSEASVASDVGSSVFKSEASVVSALGLSSAWTEVVGSSLCNGSYAEGSPISACCRDIEIWNGSLSRWPMTSGSCAASMAVVRCGSRTTSFNGISRTRPRLTYFCRRRSNPGELDGMGAKLRGADAGGHDPAARAEAVARETRCPPKPQAALPSSFGRVLET